MDPRPFPEELPGQEQEKVPDVEEVVDGYPGEVETEHVPLDRSGPFPSHGAPRPLSPRPRCGSFFDQWRVRVLVCTCVCTRVGLPVLPEQREGDVPTLETRNRGCGWVTTRV